MQEIRKKVHKFLRRNGMDHRQISTEGTVRDFLSEMERGLGGISSSLQMLPTHIDVEKEIPVDTPVIALDAGGTNFRTATIYFRRDGKPVIENYEKFPMPGLNREVTREEFFSTMAGYMRNVVKSSSSIGCCFSYPAEIMPNRDGRLLEFSKEIKAPEVVGQLIGTNLLEAIRATGHREEKRVVILNDTVATLLAGRASFMSRVFDTYIGFILGTGTNSSYIERNSNIVKCRDLDPAKSQIINLEAGNFGKILRGIIDIDFDGTMIIPGQYTFEKMISGAYFGALCLATFREAVRDKGLISKALRDGLQKLKTLDTSEVNLFMENPSNRDNPLGKAAGRGDESDCIVLYHIIDGLIERAAKLTAINLSSVIIKSGKGENPCRPVCITAEGSTFYGLKTLKTRVECHMRKYLSERYYEIVNVDNATLIGAAIAGLTN